MYNYGQLQKKKERKKEAEDTRSGGAPTKTPRDTRWRKAAPPRAAAAAPSSPRRPRPRPDTAASPPGRDSGRRRGGGHNNNNTHATRLASTRKRGDSFTFSSVSPPRRRRSAGGADAANAAAPASPSASAWRADRGRRNSRLVSVSIVVGVTYLGCLFFPLLVTLSFIVLLNRKVAALLPGASDTARLAAQLLVCVPFYFAGPILLTACAAVQILFSAYHSAASEFLLISFCLPFLFTSPWWGTWWYVSYVPAAIAVPLASLVWEAARRTVGPLWQKWSFEKGARAQLVVALNRLRGSADAVARNAGSSFPFFKYIRRFLREQFAD